MNQMIINNKKIFIFENHAEAVLPWALLSRSQMKLPFLISLDHHTDTLLAFRNDAYDMSIRNKSEIESESNNILKGFDKNNDKSLFEAIKEKYDGE